MVLALAVIFALAPPAPAVLAQDPPPAPPAPAAAAQDPPAAASAPAAEAVGTHPPLEIRDGHLQAPGGEEAEPILDVSAYCLECHAEMGDESEATPAVHPEGTDAANHPVDVAYPETARKYVERDALSPKLWLGQGQVTCVTCHDPDDPEHALVLPRRASELCRACHNI